MLNPLFFSTKAREYSFFGQQTQRIRLDGNLSFAIECADGAFECFFADSETPTDGVGVTGVGEGQAAAGFAQGVEGLVGEVADTGERCFKGADQTLRLVQIDKDVDFVAFVKFRGEIFFGKEDFSEVASVKLGSVSGEAVDA